MFRNFLVTACRNLWRSKLHSLINICSLALGLMVFAFAFLYVKQESTYDHSWPEADRIHRLIVTQQGLPGLPDGVFNTVSARIVPALTGYFSGFIDKSTRLTSIPVRVERAEIDSQPLNFADPDFLDIFQVEVVQGDLARVFAAPAYIALEENYAAALGAEGVPGQRINLVSYTGSSQQYEIAAIYRLPRNISIPVRFQLLTLLHDYSLPLFRLQNSPASVPAWHNASQLWLRLKPGVETGVFNAMQPAFMGELVTYYDSLLGPGRAITEHLNYSWQKITDLHMNPVDIENIPGFGTGNMARVLTFAVVGLLVLLVGCSNSVSISLAIALERRHEIGVRKTVGAMRQDIMLQYLGESVLFALLALVPALCLFELLQPAFVNMLPLSMQTLEITPSDYVCLVVIATLTGLLGGLYPALVLSEQRPDTALKVAAGGESKKAGSLQGLLVALQFCLASILLIGTLTLYVQLAVTRSQPLGFSAGNIAYLSLRTPEEQAMLEPLINTLLATPGVVSAEPVAMPPDANLPPSLNDYTLLRKSAGTGEVKAQELPSSGNFLSVFEIPLLAGSGYDPVRDAQNKPFFINGESRMEQRTIIINRSASKALGFAQPRDAIDELIHRRISDRQSGATVEYLLQIVGVVEDNLYMSLHRRPGPQVYSLQPVSSLNFLMVKYDSSVKASILESIRGASAEVLGYPLQYTGFVDDIVNNAFRQEQNESRLLLICAGFALLLASIGLYGLAAFVMERNVKEVGIRKVMGSSVPALMSLFLWRFSRPVLLANILAWPLAIYFVLQWIEQFPYQLEKVWLLPLCLGTAMLVLAIAMTTVSIITAKAAMSKPVQSLRYE